MKISLNSDYGITAIDFCCPDLAEKILLGTITSHYWTDHTPGFFLGEFVLKHCPLCGAKIEGVRD